MKNWNLKNFNLLMFNFKIQAGKSKFTQKSVKKNGTILGTISKKTMLYSSTHV